MVGRNELEQCNSDVVLINVSRGAVINEEALIETLQQNKIRGAGTAVVVVVAVVVAVRVVVVAAAAAVFSSTASVCLIVSSILVCSCYC